VMFRCFWPQEPAWWTRDNFAHVEAVEVGVHQITVENQPGCTVRRMECIACKEIRH
jgi:hypothetical protein